VYKILSSDVIFEGVNVSLLFSADTDMFPAVTFILYPEYCLASDLYKSPSIAILKFGPVSLQNLDINFTVEFSGTYNEHPYFQLILLINHIL
jgi:hypothetical protein